MTKVCTHGRDATLAMQMLDQSLRRLQTDHLDLWQVHGVVFDNDPELVTSRTAACSRRSTRPSSRARCASSASPATRTRTIHLRMLATGFPFDAVQMPLNAFDATYFELRAKGAAGAQQARHRARSE